MSNQHKCPLTGQPCNQSKCVHITDVADGQISELHLCKQCAGPYLEGEKDTSGVIGMTEQLPINKSCPHCGWSLAMLTEKLRFGCCKCYSFFGDEALQLMRRAHGATKHVGKVPKAWKARQEAGIKEPEIVHPDHIPPDPITVLKRSVEERIADMEAKMALKVKEEKYEDAAAIRDAIKIMKQDIE